MNILALDLGNIGKREPKTYYTLVNPETFEKKRGSAAAHSDVKSKQ